MTYTACCLSNAALTIPGWLTRADAESYVVRMCCKSCRPEGMDSPCAAEWLVMTDSDYAPSRTVGDLLEAGGYTKGE